MELNERVSVKVGAEIVGIHKSLPLCAIILESNPKQMIFVPQSYVINKEEPESIMNMRQMISESLKSMDEWEFVEGLK